VTTGAIGDGEDATVGTTSDQDGGIFVRGLLFGTARRMRGGHAARHAVQFDFKRDLLCDHRDVGALTVRHFHPPL
jgi:hypothetical protein